VYQLINAFCDEGKGVLLVTSDLPEAIGMSDRVLVMRRGRIVADVVASEASQSRIMEQALEMQTHPQSAETFKASLDARHGGSPSSGS
jgi:ABC-type sugar transport system ATPase subunit